MSKPIYKYLFTASAFQRRVVPSSILRPPGGVPLRRASDGTGADDVDADDLSPACPNCVTDNTGIGITTPTVARGIVMSVTTAVNTTAATGLIPAILTAIETSPAIAMVVVPKPAPVIGIVSPTVAAATPGAAVAAVHQSHHHGVVSTTITLIIREAAAIFTAAMFINASTIPSVSDAPTTSRGGCSPGGVGVANGVVDDVVASCRRCDGGDGGGLQDEMAKAVTTDESVSVTAPTVTAPTITRPALTASSIPGAKTSSSFRHHSDAGIIMDDVTPALLPTVVIMSSSNFSSGDRGRSSEGPRGDRRCPAHSLPPPAVVEVRVAWHGGGRPTAYVNTASTTMPPRPDPVSLLSALRRPQPGRVTQHGSRAGEPLRAARTVSTGVSNIGDRRRRT